MLITGRRVQKVVPVKWIFRGATSRRAKDPAAVGVYMSGFQPLIVLALADLGLRPRLIYVAPSALAAGTLIL